MASSARPSSATSSVPVGRVRTVQIAGGHPARGLGHAAERARQHLRRRRWRRRARRRARARARPRDVAEPADRGGDLVERDGQAGGAARAAGQRQRDGRVHAAARGRWRCSGVDDCAPPASAAATSGRSRWFSTVARPASGDLRVAEDGAVGVDEGDAPAARAGRARRPARPSGRDRDRVCAAGRVLDQREPHEEIVADPIEQVRLDGRAEVQLLGQQRDGDEAERDREQLAADVQLHGSSSSSSPPSPRRPRPRGRAPG